MNGDTIPTRIDGHPVKVRLAGIDLPEKRQPFGAVSINFDLVHIPIAVYPATREEKLSWIQS